MGLLYVSENDAVIGINSGKFYVKHKDEIVEIPEKTVTGISIFGYSQMTTQCIRYCLDENIRVCFFSKAGKYSGCLNSAGFDNINRIEKQLELFKNKEVCLCLSKKIVSAKINNQLVVVHRYMKEKDAFGEQIKQMKIAKNKVMQCDSVSQIMGYEGIASRNYFDILSGLVCAEFCFFGRNRRPPKDPFNAMLSLGYSLLTSEISGEIENIGLSSEIGFFHQTAVNNPALASDLIEEWRPVLIDSLVMSLVQGKEIHKEQFLITEQGCYLNNEGKSIYLGKLEKKLHQSMQYLNYINKPVSFRLGLWHQIQCMRQVIEESNAELYNPVTIR